MKISVVTAVYNRVDCIASAVGSVRSQSWENVEHLVIDGASTDGTLQVLKSCLNETAVLVSEQDEGIYDALNKGFALARGDVIGIMHSDDTYADTEVLASVAAAFVDPEVDAVYGDLDYVSKLDTSRIVRRWRSCEFSEARLAHGWMPPHPTLFLHRRVIDRWGGFDTQYHVAADYDAILRYFGGGKIRSVYIPRVLVKMRLGGESNRSLSRILVKTREDYTALRRNGVGGFAALVWKNVGKLPQFF